MKPYFDICDRKWRFSEFEDAAFSTEEYGVSQHTAESWLAAEFGASK